MTAFLQIRPQKKGRPKINERVSLADKTRRSAGTTASDDIIAGRDSKWRRSTKSEAGARTEKGLK
jgi:hypothetical protein